MAFVNTEDIIGVQALEDQYLERTLTEFRDDRITSLRPHAFDSCSSLTVVDLPCVTHLPTLAFGGCSALRTMILRASSVCTCTSNAFPSNAELYFYVPKALVDSYKSATNWSNYADQIRAIEDYPEITGGV